MGTKTKYEVNFQKSPFQVEISFEKTLFVDTPLTVEKLKQIEKLHGGLFNHWVCDIIHITVKTCYDFQYLTMHLSGYMNSPTEPALISLKHSIEYLMHHPHETIMY